ncbi:ABC transporter family substrate-binding protein [Bifidobacterium jacchi]|uniref:ABC transporter family substrate-binding protein n=1 Tax=Bifidobacterium jacchi TaxID=2490545 RepID=A0A5N5RLW9_9BIFI|nr:ABC transporter family substrate-binding protein [Bifidobacterium jacchi]KAB5607930.1 ABC transporter family substrate-binding protein [Bifidobacterium jacchi]
MRNRIAARLTALTALVASMAMVSACGGASTNGSQQTITEEPSEGIPSTYQGALPTPDPTKRYDNPQPRDNIKDGGTLRVPTSTIGENWNFMNADGNNASIGRFWYYYQPHLWDYAVDGTPTPNPDYLVDAKVISKDPQVVQYDINPKAKWNDGTPIDWTAFEATAKAMSGKGGYVAATTAGYDQISKVEKGDNDQQVKVTFSKPFYPYQTLFPNLVNPKAADEKTFNQGWVNEPHNEWSAGPYVVDSHDENKVVFKANPKWWGNKPKLDTVEFISMTDNATINAFRNGEVDLIGANASMGGGVASQDKLKAVRGMKDVQLRIGYTLTTDFLIYNTKSSTLSDKAVRKALTQAFDGNVWTQIRYQGIDWKPVEPGSLILYPFQKGYADNRPKESAFSVDAAKKTLEDAGYTMGSDGYYQKDGKTLTVGYTMFGSDAIKTNSAKAYQSMMKKAGIKIDIKAEASSKSSEIVQNGAYDVLPMAWGASDPFGYATSLYQIYGSDSPSNYSYIGDAATDKLLNEPGNIENMTDAIKVANKAEASAMALYGQYPTVVEPDYTAVRKGLANFGPCGFASIEQHVEDIGWQK